MLKKLLYLFPLPLVLLASCTKNEKTVIPDKPKTDTAAIALRSFGFEDMDTSLVIVNYSKKGDTINVTVPGTTDLSALKALVKYKGESISLDLLKEQDFREPIEFSIKGKDGTERAWYLKVSRRDILYVGTAIRIMALDAGIGKLLWQDSSNVNYAYSDPQVVGDTLYVGGIDGNMYAYNAITGKRIWKTFLSTTGIEGPATIHGNTLYVGTNDDYFYALDPANGNIKWQYRTGANLSNKPVIYNNTVIFGSSDGYVYALDTATAQPAWEFYTGMMVSSAPTLSNGVIFIGSRLGYIYAINAATGQEKWRHSTGVSMEQSKVIVVNGTIFTTGWYDFSSGQNIGGAVYALNENTGDRVWTVLDYVGFSGELTYDNGSLFVSADNGNFYSLKEGNGSVNWSSPILPNGAGSVVNNGVVYVGGTGTDKFYAFNAATGSTVWTYDLANNDWWTSTPAIRHKK